MQNIITRLLITVLIALSIQGCNSLGPRGSSSRDLANVLAPVKDSLVVKEKKPLVFPTTVAILMVPGTNSNMVPNSTLRLAAEQLKKKLLKNEKYINGVSIISDGDIREKISLDTIHDLYGVDIIVVLSYQQDQRRTQNSFASMLDIAIAPAFMLPSVKVTTSTVIDGKIIHIPSNAIIFRSSGVDERAIQLTRVSSDGSKSNEESIKGFTAAVDEFGENVGKKLKNLDEFDISNSVSLNKLLNENNGTQKTDTVSTGDGWTKVDSYKSSGGGAFGLIEILAICSLTLFRILSRRKV
ncbi:MAG: rhombotarget lipoprotein [Agitococcus sp.]|nr:rhombotarget lipoprotein [Agitococcus sp.]